MPFAAVFPGQGSQSLGMLAELARQHPIVEQVFAEASTVLGYDLWSLAQRGPEQELNNTLRTQPAMLTAGVAAWRLWQERGGPAPRCLAGHSLGEYSALVAAGALSFTDAVKLVARRAELMQAAVPDGAGAMAAILGLDDDAVASVCMAAASGETVTPVNFNAPGQVVIAGHRAAVERAIVSARVAGAKRAIILPVSVPSHCALMQPAAEQFAKDVAAIAWIRPALPVLQNADIAVHVEIPVLREKLVEQLYKPVRWVETVQAMRAQGVDILIEFGPGRVLAGLAKRISRELRVFTVHDPESLEDALASAQESS
jgi:[acyl-carrier-protein] S-malonyltransferase